MSSLRSLLLLIVIVSVAGCDSSSDGQSTFDTAFFDTEGVELARVEIAFDMPTGDVATDGRFEVTSGELIYLVVEQGTVSASSAGSVLSVQLNAGASDSGVTLVGAFGGDNVTGDWRYLTIAGEVPGGTFRATRR